MPAVYHSLHFHIIFSTKNRIRAILPHWQSALHDCLRLSAAELGAPDSTIGGVADHVHLLVQLKSNQRLSDFIRELKATTAEWVRATAHDPDFNWQDGYSAFTVSPTSCHTVRNYIATQELHHRKQTLRAELAQLMERAGIPFDLNQLD